MTYFLTIFPKHMKLSPSQLVTKTVQHVSDISWSLSEIRCNRHTDIREYCDFKIFLKDYQLAQIHCVDRNYIIKNYKIVCLTYPSIQFTLLHLASHLCMCEWNDNEQNYVKINGQLIYQIKRAWITEKLLYRLNEWTITGRLKSSGWCSFCIYFVIILYLF